MARQKIKPLNEAERQWVVVEVANARRLVEIMSPADAESEMSPEVLDRVYKTAREAAGNDASGANAIINAVGMAFGQYLVDKLGFGWVTVFDRHGAELAVIALPGHADIVVFPPNLVGKRWESGTVNFLNDVYLGIVENLEQVKADLAARPGTEPSPQRTGAPTHRSWIQMLFRRGPGR